MITFWTRLFGVKQSPKADAGERDEATRSSATSNAQPPSILAIPDIEASVIPTTERSKIVEALNKLTIAKWDKLNLQGPFKEHFSGNYYPNSLADYEITAARVIADRCTVAGVYRAVKDWLGREPIGAIYTGRVFEVSNINEKTRGLPILNCKALTNHNRETVVFLLQEIKPRYSGDGWGYFCILRIGTDRFRCVAWEEFTYRSPTYER